MVFLSEQQVILKLIVHTCSFTVTLAQLAFDSEVLKSVYNNKKGIKLH